VARFLDTQKGCREIVSAKLSIDFRYAPPISWTSICRPDDPFKTLVVANGNWIAVNASGTVQIPLSDATQIIFQLSG
jgi:hypothetical protein